ncbi:MAG: alpha-mannosidase [Microcoleus sp. PH2017_07_MST_O_A]|nr:alpha-mannosidase [Microcoleus sp. PH2017_07_MST_O_A]MCC3509708.1 alpha-mannosidase [Microcoleus sp. PH2017_17_BER_D_A]
MSLIESQFLPEVADVDSQSDVSQSPSRENLPISEVVETLSDVASGNLLENSTISSESRTSTQETPASLPIAEVVETLSDVASGNLLENSTTSSESRTSTRETPTSLPIAEFVETLSDVAPPNLLENSATLPGSRTSSQETSASLQAETVVKTLSDVAPPKLVENSANLPESLNSNLKTPASLPIPEVVETLSGVASENSANLPESLNSNLKTPASLPIPEFVETLSDVAPPNLLENSATLPESRTSSQETPASLQAETVVKTLSDVAPPKLVENSANLPESLNSNLKTPASLPIPEVVETLSGVASGKLLENSTSSSESETNSVENEENLQLRKTTENLSGLVGDFSGKFSESEPKYLDFPTEIHQEKSQLKNSPSLPLSPSPNLPIWKDELYLEFHRGCYTTRADQKRQNRRCEDLLYQAELLSSIATICTGAVYPKVELELAWKQVLFNQFHDILPGSAIAQVYTDANLAFAEVDRSCHHILLQSLDAIAAQISLPSPPQSDAQPIFVFNSLNWSRSEVVAVTLPDSPDAAWQIYDLSGGRLTSQIVKGDRLPSQSQSTLLFSAQSVPAIGYRVFWLCHGAQTLNHAPASSATEKKTDLSKLTYGIAQKNTPCQETHFSAPETVLENELIRATVDAETGNLSSIWDKANNREVLNAVGGNQLQAFQDSGQYWDAWNIDPNYQKHPLPAPILKQISWVDRGEVRQSLRVVMQIGKSEFRQDYIVETGSPLLKIKTVVDWQETHVLVKTAFGLNVAADFATCEIPGGAIARTTKPQTPAEKAKWEVPIFRWTDISNDGFGVSLLNDCKYGCDIQPNQIRLTLLRSSTWPDEAADVGVSQFTCAVYPHAGNWQDAGTVRRGCELNMPLLVKVLSQLPENRDRTLPPVGKFLDLSAENLVLMAFKQSEDDANVWIFRCCESEGKQAVLALDGDLGLEILESVDLLERPAILSEKLPLSESFKIEPWKIASFAVVTNHDSALVAKEEREGKKE